MEQAVAYAPVTQRARVRSPVGTRILGEVFSGFSLRCKTNAKNFGPHSSPVITWPSYIIQTIYHPSDRLFGIVVSTSDCYQRGPGVDSRLYPRNFSWTWSTQPREDNWVAIWMRSSEIWLRKLKLRLRNNALLTARPPVLPSGSNRFSRSWLFGGVAPRIFKENKALNFSFLLYYYVNSGQLLNYVYMDIYPRHCLHVCF